MYIVTELELIKNKRQEIEKKLLFIISRLAQKKTSKTKVYRQESNKSIQSLLETNFL